VLKNWSVAPAHPFIPYKTLMQQTASGNMPHFTIRERYGLGPLVPSPECIANWKSPTCLGAQLEVHESCSRCRATASSNRRRCAHQPTNTTEITMFNKFGRKLLLGVAIACSFGMGYAFAVQGHMLNALSLLRQARSELIAAAPNKGGHRGVAIDMVNRAINQTIAGIEFARSRGED
jgi:hypothetical protein